MFLTRACRLMLTNYRRLRPASFVLRLETAPINIGAVLGAQVTHNQSPIQIADLAVDPAHALVIEMDINVLVSSQDCGQSIEHEATVRRKRTDGDQFCFHDR